jgi:chemotaxis signal transduction protein
LENDTDIFSINDKEHHIQGAIAVRDEVIRVVSLKEAKDANDIVVVELGDKRVAIVVDEVYDIENFVDAKIELIKESQSAIGAFYNYKGDVVAIINPHFYFQDIESEASDEKEQQNTLVHTKHDYLIFMMDAKKYSIDMKCVRQVLETDSLVKTQSSSIIASDNIEFIATWNKHAVNIIKLNNLLGLEGSDNNSQTIIIEYEGHLVSFMVEDIDNIVYLNSSEISQVASESNSLINGAIVHDNEVIVTLNAAFLANIG